MLLHAINRSAFSLELKLQWRLVVFYHELPVMAVGLSPGTLPNLPAIYTSNCNLLVLEAAS